MSMPADAFFADLQKGIRKMFITPNYSKDYRNWAYCCAAITRLIEEIEYCENGPIPGSAYGYCKANGMKAFLENRKKIIPKLTRKISHYAALRDKLAAELVAPEKHLLQLEDMLNMVGNVIEITPRHSKKRTFKALSECSADGKRVNKLDAYDLMSFGYGK
jgi:hypothetical protein